jgi:hypothetical protein
MPKRTTRPKLPRTELDQVIDTLNRHKRRATYGAVAAVVGSTAQQVMAKRTPCWKDSWVVLKATYLPSHKTYKSKALFHPDLQSNPIVLETKDQLNSWLAEVLIYEVTQSRPPRRTPRKPKGPTR